MYVCYTAAMPRSHTIATGPWIGRAIGHAPRRPETLGYCLVATGVSSVF